MECWNGMLAIPNSQGVVTKSSMELLERCELRAGHRGVANVLAHYLVKTNFRFFLIYLVIIIEPPLRGSAISSFSWV